MSYINIFEEWESIEGSKRHRRPFLKYCEVHLGRKIPPQDLCKLELRKGDSALIPSGWIHNVVTTEDSLVFGGNCLNDFCAEMQLKCYKIEQESR